MSYEISISVKGDAEEVETQYGPRINRETLASLTVEVTHGSAWNIYTEALRAATERDREVSISNVP